MYKVTIEDLDKIKLNRYEAVIVASQQARSLNNKRLRALEKMEENPTVEIEARKMTMVAMKDLLDGKIKFFRADSI